MAADRRILILLKIAGEGRLADHVGTRCVMDDILQMCGSLAYEAIAYIIGEEAHILTDHKEMQEIVLRRSLLHEIQMAIRERVCIQYNRCRRAVCHSCSCFCL